MIARACLLACVCLHAPCLHKHIMSGTATHGSGLCSGCVRVYTQARTNNSCWRGSGSDTWLFVVSRAFGMTACMTTCCHTWWDMHAPPDHGTNKVWPDTSHSLPTQRGRQACSGRTGPQAGSCARAVAYSGDQPGAATGHCACMWPPEGGALGVAQFILACSHFMLHTVTQAPLQSAAVILSRWSVAHVWLGTAVQQEHTAPAWSMGLRVGVVRRLETATSDRCTALRADNSCSLQGATQPRLGPCVDVGHRCCTHHAPRLCTVHGRHGRR